MNKVYAILVSTLVVLHIQETNAQDIDFNYYKKAYPTEDFIELNNISKYKLSLERGVVKIQEENFERRLYLSEIATRYNERHIQYDSFELISEIKAETNFRNKTGKYERKKVSDFETKDVLINGIFYGDYKSKSFVYPAISVGSYTDLSYKKEILNPRFLAPFTFNANIKIVSSELTIETDRNIKLGFRVFGQYANSIEYTQKSLRRGKTLHTWKGIDLPKIPNEENSLSSSYYRTHIIPFIEYYIKEDGDTVRIARSVDDLYSWYTDLVGSIVEPEDSLYVKTATEIKNSSKNEIELVENIYKWVQQNIDYIAFEDGYGGFIPRTATNVYRRKYGDCKDMAFLLKQMLKSVGVEGVYLAWIGTREKPYSYLELPTPLVDNHMITMVSTEEGNIFLDATNAYTPYGLPSSFIQGKEVLIGIDEETYQIREVPVVAKEMNQQIDSIFVRIEGDTLVGRNHRKLTGYKRVDADYALEHISPSKYDEFFDTYFSKGSNKFAVTEIDYSSLLNKRVNEAEIFYSFMIPDYVRSVRNKIYINPSFDRSFIDRIKDISDRELDYVEDYKFKDVVFTRIEIPNGYEVDYLPENIERETRFYGYKVTYAQEETYITVSSELYHNFLVLEPNEFEEYKAFLETVSDSFQESISFKLSVKN